MITTEIICSKSTKIFIIFAICGFALFEPIIAQSDQLFRFFDGFETDQGWSGFEEIVNACYGSGIGEVARSTDVAFEGAYSLRVWANKALSAQSDHVIAHKKVSSSGQTGRFRYQLYAYIAPETANQGETGPEFSMQNTREITPGAFRTSTVGIQYRANPFSPLYRSWGVWTKVGGTLEEGEQAAWETFTTTNALLPAAWYFMAVEADYTTNRYVRFWLRGPGIDLSIDLSSYSIARESKFTEQAFELTLEGENLFNNCGTAESFDYKLYYDNVTLEVPPVSSCLWGLYIDDHQTGGDWESRLFLSNIDAQNTHNYDVFVLATDTVHTKSLILGPSGIVGLTCSDLQACGAGEWLYVQSDAPVFGSSLFVINNRFGGGAFTAQSGNCQFGP